MTRFKSTNPDMILGIAEKGVSFFVLLQVVNSKGGTESGIHMPVWRRRRYHGISTQLLVAGNISLANRSSRILLSHPKAVDNLKS